MFHQSEFRRREFLQQAAVASAAGVVASLSSTGSAETQPGETQPAPNPPTTEADAMPCGMIGKAKISRMLLGGNLVAGFMHSRDLHYVNSLFRAYMTEDRILETFRLAEQHGINTVFESGAAFVERYNRKMNGHMQFIPHIEIQDGQTEQALKDHIKAQVDLGSVALYVWGVASDNLVKNGKADLLAKGVELAKKYDLPVGVGSHSLEVPMICEKMGVPCDFYVKTFHSDDYPSATPKEKRKEYMWLTGGDGWYDNMWCINPEETVAFMKEVKKPWIAFKVLAAGALRPQQAFPHAFKSGADFIAVGMFDFHVADNCELVRKVVRREQKRERPWRA